MSAELIERFAEMRSQRIKNRYRAYLKESQWQPSPKLANACTENESYFKTGIPELSKVSVPLILRYDLKDGGPPVMELVLLHDIHRSNHGHILRGYSVLYDRILHYNADNISDLRQGTNNTPLASLEYIAERYKHCAGAEYTSLRAELHALLYLAVQDSVIQESEIQVVKSFLASKPLSVSLQQEFLFYFQTSFITPNAFGEVVDFLATLPLAEREYLLDTGIALIEANGAVSQWEKLAFEELVRIVEND